MLAQYIGLSFQNNIKDTDMNTKSIITNNNYIIKIDFKDDYINNSIDLNVEIYEENDYFMINKICSKTYDTIKDFRQEFKIIPTDKENGYNLDVNTIFGYSCIELSTLPPKLYKGELLNDIKTKFDNKLSFRSVVDIYIVENSSIEERYVVYIFNEYKEYITKINYTNIYDLIKDWRLL